MSEDNIYTKPMDVTKLHLDSKHVLVQFRSLYNLVWGKPIDGKEAFAFVKGFPGTFIMTERRVILIAQFTEKQGWFQEKTFRNVCFEAGLHQLIKFENMINVPKRTFFYYLKFAPHGMLGESILQFTKVTPPIADALDQNLKSIKISKPIEDTGIIRFDIDPVKWANGRLTR